MIEERFGARVEPRFHQRIREANGRCCRASSIHERRPCHKAAHRNLDKRRELSDSDDPGDPQQGAGANDPQSFADANTELDRRFEASVGWAKRSVPTSCFDLLRCPRGHGAETRLCPPYNALPLLAAPSASAALAGCRASPVRRRPAGPAPPQSTRSRPAESTHGRSDGSAPHSGSCSTPNTGPRSPPAQRRPRLRTRQSRTARIVSAARRRPAARWSAGTPAARSRRRR